MLKIMKKTFAVLIVSALFLGLTACHRAGEVALTVDGEKFTSGFYACALLTADNQAMQKASEAMDQTSVDSTNKNYLSQQIDGVDYSQWVKNRAVEICKEFVAAKRLCEKNNVTTADYIEDAKTMAEYYWNNGMEQFYTANGVGLETFKNFSAYDSYKNAYFDYLYGENGTQAVSNEEIENHLTQKYAYVNALTSNITDLSDEEVEEARTKMNSYADRIYAGESFAKIYSEVNGTEYSEDSTDMGTFSNTLASVWGDEDTQYENELFEYTKELKNNEVMVVTHTTQPESEKYLVLIFKGDILSDKNTNLTSLKNAARTDLKGGDLEKAVQEAAKDLSVKESKYATNRFKVKKIDYLED